ncbi:hypothetical protein P8Q88_07455 [Qipengyuania sp. XHP0207]|uniref:hypothetical protein n=1 Tax=Qipengyuania sp. XHP0207 TaxID=3038078 RepID=UPI00241D2B7F|nr:hypothetical protein [Qipengyuania sp. XHP0207]MDG5748013.1 hypothetical protein [Qipengyuania sp. XHP0207]
MKPESISRFELWYFLAVGASILSTALGWAGMEVFTEMLARETRPRSKNMGFVLLVSSLAMFVVLSMVMWAAIVLSRWGAARWLLVAAILYAGYAAIRRLAGTALDASVVTDLMAVVFAAVGASYLFRKDAREWFAKSDDDSFHAP